MTFVEKVNKFLHSVGLDFITLIVGFIGSYFSLPFFPGISWKRKVLLFFSGGISAAFGGQLIASFIQMDHLIYSSSFFFGVLGMVFMEIVVEVVRAIPKNLKEILAIAKFFLKK